MPMNRNRLRARRPSHQRNYLFETLEPRQLLAADLALNVQPSEAPTKDDLQPTLFYQAGDTEVGLSVLNNKIAVAIVPEQLIALPRDFVFDRQLSESLSVYSFNPETLAAGANMADEWPDISGVKFISPVFHNPDANSEVVATNEVIIALDGQQSAEEYFGSVDIYAAFRPLRGSTNQFVATLATGYGTATIEAANSALKDPGVEWATPNFYFDLQKAFTPNDPRFTNQWHLENTGQGGGVLGADANLTEAWDVNPGGSADIVIGVIDDSVDFHEDLVLFVNAGEIPGNGVDDDGNGWIDDVNGWNFVSDNNASTPTFTSDVHGTAVAGVAAGQGDNGIGVTGASYRSPVISARIFEGNSVATEANIAEALRYMAGFNASGTGTWRSADVVNNSWSGGPNSAAINSALTDGTTLGRQGKGTPYFFSSGNGFSASLPQPATQSTNIPGVFAIGSSNNFDVRSAYSNFGTGLDFVTPSNDTVAGTLAIDTTDRMSVEGYNTALDGHYTGTGATGFGGTSSASPLAAGIAALTIAQLEATGRDFTPAVLRDYLRANTDLIGGLEYDPATGWTPETAYGRLNAGSALQNIGKAEVSVLSSTQDLVSGVSEVDVGSAVVGLTPTQATLRIRNQGTEPLSLTGLSIGAGPFSIATGLGSNLLGVGEATTFVVEFNPTAPGIATGTATLTSNDSDEATFTINFSGLGLIASVSGIAFEDHNADGVPTANELPVANSIAYLDLNNNSVRDVVSATFATTTPVNIVDNTEVFSPIVVSGAPSPISSIVVEVDIEHTFVSDLDLIVIAPDGTEVLLASAVGGGGNNFTDTVFADDADVSIVDGSAPFTGTFRPQQPLAGLLGANPEGTWQLSVEDFATFDEGQILGWSITFSDSEPNIRSEEDGSFAFFNLPNGDYILRSEAPAGWTGSTDASYAFTIDEATDAFPGSDFGVGKNDRFYGLVYDDANADGVQGPGETSLPSWTVFLDANNNGSLDAPSPTTFTNSTPVAITDNTVVTSDIAATGLAGVVLDVNVQVNITHTFNADLDVFLIAPDGTRVELFTDVGGAGDNFVGTILDDEAATSILSGSAPFTGSFRPEGLLADFDGLSPNGTWQLEIGDDAGGDVGTLNSWELVLTTGELTDLTDLFGETTFDLPTGTHAIGLVLESGWEFTFPNDGFISATASGVPIYSQAFGVREPVMSEVTTRGIYYNNATGSQLGSGGDAANALDPTKQPLLPGETSTFSNYSNYQRGLNGFLFDITGLSTGATEQEVLDSLEFAVWNGIDAAGFVALPAAAVPSVELVTIDGATRVKVSFPDGSLMNTWLRTTVLSNATTNLPIEDIFYFGHVLADVGVGNTETRIRVDALDTVFVRANQSIGANSADASNRYDLNRDGRVDAIDTVIVRANQELAGIVAPISAPNRSKANTNGGKGAFGKFEGSTPGIDPASVAAPAVTNTNGLNFKSETEAHAMPSFATIDNGSADPIKSDPTSAQMAQQVHYDREITKQTEDDKDYVFELLGNGDLSIRLGKLS